MYNNLLIIVYISKRATLFCIKSRGCSGRCSGGSEFIQDYLPDSAKSSRTLQAPISNIPGYLTDVTWHPEVYKYGKDEYRIERMELLRNAGFYIELMNESCQHYAVIDGELVWYGSMNLLSKDDVEDNIMRVSSKAIAAELRPPKALCRKRTLL